MENQLERNCHDRNILDKLYLYDQHKNNQKYALIYKNPWNSCLSAYLSRLNIPAIWFATLLKIYSSNFLWLKYTKCYEFDVSLGRTPY